MAIVLRPVRGLLLAGPFVLAFASGGFDSTARLIALVVAGATLVAVALATREPVPRAGPGRLAVGSLFALAGWVALSHGWAPLPDRVGDDLERTLLFATSLAVAAVAWRPSRSLRIIEPAFAAGAVVVVAYGLAGRLLPGIVHLSAGAAAGGRLDQPLTYWNAEGVLAAMGLVLCARIAGDESRLSALRAAATPGAVVLLTGAYLTFSRGALAAMAAGLVVLLLLAPTWSQLRGIAICVEAGVAGALAAGIGPGVREISGPLGSREAQGAAVLGVLLAVMAVAALVQAHACRMETEGRLRVGALGLSRGLRAAALAVAIGLVLVPAVAVSTSDAPRDAPAFGATNQRLSSLGSNRREYWRVALEVFADHPVRGAGSGAFAAEWLRRRSIDETVRDAHSLELEALAELGLVGFAVLALLIGSIAACARRALRADAGLACGAAATLVVWVLHSAIDWDWEMPAVTLVAVLLAGALIAAADPPAARRAP